MTASGYGNIEPGSQVRLISETVSAAGVTERECSVQSDTVLVTLWAEAMTGTLDVTVYSFTDDEYQRKVALFTFPSLSSPTSFLLQKRASVTTSRVLVVVTYTGSCNYEIYLRAVQAGLVETRIVGASSLRMSQKDITPAVDTILAASLTDRAGIVIKNFSAAGTIFLGGTAPEATTANGYPLGPKDALAIDLAAGQTLYAAADAGTVDVRISESGN